MKRAELQKYVDCFIVGSYVGPLSEREVYELLRALGMSVSWAPWWKRVWWAMRRAARRILR